MPDYFRAIAVDFDGTLTTGGRPADGLLVTGRILSELRAVFGDVDAWFDAIVAENGALSRAARAPVSWRHRAGAKME